MGIYGLWPFLKKKGYEPIAYRRPHSSNATKIRVDILGTFFALIAHAYSSHPAEKAHLIVEQQIQKISPKQNLILYFDGAPCAEKRDTSNYRLCQREKYLDIARKAMDTLNSRTENNLRLRKRHFTAVARNLKRAFYWPVESRAALVEYLQKKGWNAIMCRTEADLQIAQDYEPNDVVVTRDSDLLVYDNINTIWRPVTRDLTLVYDVPRVLETLSYTRAKLSVLGIVSKNDYNHNIPRLGCELNFGIIKSLSEGDAKETLKSYLSHEAVLLKNKGSEKFIHSTNVFIHRTQTLLELDPSVQASEPAPETCFDLRTKFNQLCKVLKDNRNRKSRQTNGLAEGVNSKGRGGGFNRYQTVDRPVMPEAAEAMQVQSQIAKYKPRYSVKHRLRKVEYEAPTTMKEYVLKPWKVVPESPDVVPESLNVTTNTPLKNKSATPKAKVKPKGKAKPKAKAKQKDPKEMNRANISYAMRWEHPIVALDIGTLSANIKGALEDEELANETLAWLREAVRTAAKIKKECQFLIGRFIEALLLRGNFVESDRTLLDMICPRIPEAEDASDEAKDASDEEKDVSDEEKDASNEEKDASNEEKDDKLPLYIQSLMIYLYSGNEPRKGQKEKKEGPGLVRTFITRAQALGLLGASRHRNEVRRLMTFTPTSLLRSVASQLTVEVRRMYMKGSWEVHEKLLRLKNRGILPENCDIDINHDLSAIENFVKLNSLDGNKRRIAPLSSMQLPFVSFTEGDLIEILWKNTNWRLKEKLKAQVVGIEHNNLQGFQRSCSYSNNVGHIVTTFISSVGRPITVRKGRRGLKDKTRTMSPDDLIKHITDIRRDDFDPEKYRESGYALTGTIRTDGFRIQLLAYKLKELQCVRFKRLPENKLPSQFTSTLGGLDRYLTEVRNVVKSKDDVSKLWGCEPQDIKILGLDLGQACVLGASAILPAADNSKDYKDDSRPVFHNLAVKQKAVYQPTFKFRRWLEYNKNAAPSGTKSINEIESDLPAVRGDGSSIGNYFEEFGKAEERLHDFYDGDKNIVKRHQWDARKARDTEYTKITDRLLKLIGGSMGQKRAVSNKVVIGIGLGKFSSTMRLSSLHQTFLSYFVQKVRSLGYIVVGVNEYYTSKKCPVCENFVGQVEIRRLYCKTCKTYLHRDVMAGHNICNVVRGHLLYQQRPQYLQPVDKDGNYPWMPTSGLLESGISTEVELGESSRQGGGAKPNKKREAEP